MSSRELAGLEHTEISLSTATFAVVLGHMVISSLVLYTATPYTFVDIDLSIFRLIWITSAMVVGLSFTTICIFLYSKHIMLERPRHGRFFQYIGLITFVLEIMSFIISFGGLVWGYADTSELLQFENEAVKVLLFLLLICFIAFGAVLVMAHALLTRCFCRDSNFQYRLPD
jgi:hypothetical protein